MTMQEASYIVKKNEDEYIEKWNHTRYIAYAIIQSQSTKSLKVTDVLKFPWEEKDEPVKTKEEIQKQKEELLKYALDLEKKLNQDGR